MQLVALPEVSTTTEFKKRVEHACKTFHLDYEAVVTRLLEEWMNTQIKKSQTILRNQRKSAVQKSIIVNHLIT